MCSSEKAKGLLYWSIWRARRDLLSIVTLGATYEPKPAEQILAKLLILLVGAAGLEPATR